MEQIFRFFEETGSQYVNNTLCQVEEHLLQMQEDNNFALQMFFFYWAYERAGASQGYRVAAVKAIQEVINNPYHLITYYYRRLYTERRNEARNPCCDPMINGLDIANIINVITNSENPRENLRWAFEQLNLRGLGHKIKSFFLRDIYYLTVDNFIDFELADYLFLMPVDTWITQISELVENRIPENQRPVIPGREIIRTVYNLSGKRRYFCSAVYLVTLSLRYNVSPLLVNMGMWYFCSKYVQNERRLRNLFDGNCEQILNNLQSERNLMGIFGQQKFTLP